MLVMFVQLCGPRYAGSLEGLCQCLGFGLNDWVFLTLSGSFTKQMATIVLKMSK